MLPISVDELLMVLGTKEAELFVLRRQVAKLEAQLQAHQDGSLQAAPASMKNGQKSG